jgi:hypothetical protein
MESASHRLAFACDIHFGVASGYIVGWADFMATERGEPGSFLDTLQLTGVE